MKIITIIALILGFSLLMPQQVDAVNNPLSVENNSYGIHITDENDLAEAANLVNSNNGKWGYVTVVIRDDQMDRGYWQDMFDKMRRLHLIPIVRIATHQQGGNWAAPTPESARKWAEFLHSLNWVIQNRYVVLFNEVNRAHEWGGKLSPSEYTEVIKAYKEELKKLSDDFFILPAGLDMSAPNSRTTRNGLDYYRQMYEADKEVFTYFDGWTSHAYPTAGIDTFIKETDFLKDFGLSNNIPIFITEAGWKNDDPDLVKNFEDAYKNIWNNPQVVAITPFILNYKGEPFADYSWKKPDGNLNPQFELVQKIVKKTGMPIQINSAELMDDPLPDALITDSNYLLDVKIKNTGQTIWYPGEVKVVFQNQEFTNDIVEPGQEAVISFTLDTPSREQKHSFTLDVLYNGKQMLPKISKEISFIPPTSLSLYAPLGFKFYKHNSSDSNLLIYDGDRFILKLINVAIENNRAKIADLRDVIPGKTYRFVLTKPGYLPSQTYQYLDQKVTNVNFPPLKPFDPNLDGSFNFQDIFFGVSHPIQLIKLVNPF